MISGRSASMQHRAVWVQLLTSGQVTHRERSGEWSAHGRPVHDLDMSELPVTRPEWQPSGGLTDLLRAASLSETNHRKHQTRPEHPGKCDIDHC